MASTSRWAYQVSRTPKPAKACIPLAVFADARHCDIGRLLSAHAFVARRDHQAGGQALHVPLERPRQGLVEVVEVEHQVALG